VPFYMRSLEISILAEAHVGPHASVRSNDAHAKPLFGIDRDGHHAATTDILCFRFDPDQLDGRKMRDPAAATVVVSGCAVGSSLRNNRQADKAALFQALGGRLVERRRCQGGEAEAFHPNIRRPDSSKRISKSRTGAAPFWWSSVNPTCALNSPCARGAIAGRQRAKEFALVNGRAEEMRLAVENWRSTHLNCAVAVGAAA
jgi:hypothetical protein